MFLFLYNVLLPIAFVFGKVFSKTFDDEEKDGNEGHGDEADENPEGGIEEPVGFDGRQLFHTTIIHCEEHAKHSGQYGNAQCNDGDKFAC